MKDQLSRNVVGFFLTIVGVLVIMLGAHWHMAELIVLGTATLIPAALLAFRLDASQKDHNREDAQRTLEIEEGKKKSGGAL